MRLHYLYGQLEGLLAGGLFGDIRGQVTIHLSLLPRQEEVCSEAGASLTAETSFLYGRLTPYLTLYNLLRRII